MRLERKKAEKEKEKKCVHKTNHRQSVGQRREVAQPSRFVKDKRLRRACGILDKPRRLSCVAAKSLRGKLCQSELPCSNML